MGNDEDQTAQVPDDAPTPPHGVPALPSKDVAVARRGARRVAPTQPVDRHERLLLDLVDRIEVRMNRRSGR